MRRWKDDNHDSGEMDKQWYFKKTYTKKVVKHGGACIKECKTLRNLLSNIKHTLGKVIKLWRKPPWLINLNDSDHDVFTQFFSGSMVTESNRFRNKIRAQSMMRMIRWGGFCSFLTDATWAGLMVCRAASASASAGLATSSFFSALFLSALTREKLMYICMWDVGNLEVKIASALQ